MGQPSGDFSQENLRVRAGTLVSGRYLVTVGGPDGSDVQPCPPERWPAAQLLAADAQRPGGRTALGPGPSPAVGPLAMGAGPGDLPLLDREAEVAELLGKLAEGRSIRLVGEQGSGCSALLSAVVEGAGELAPHGVVQLSGHRKTAADLLQDLFAATHRAPEYRPDRGQLPGLLAQVGAVVVIDEVRPDGAELEELLAAAPECAFLICAAPGSGGVLPVGSRLEDHLVGGLSRVACLALTARLAGRPLDDAERAWAIDLWFESEGLPLRFVQAAALLRQRDIEVDALIAAEEDRRGVFGDHAEDADEADPTVDPAIREGELRAALPLPSLAESAAPARRLAQGLSEPAQAVLRLSLALGGECPTAPHLPALIQVDHGESALRELADRGLAETVGGHHRLTVGVLEALAEQWPPQDTVHGAARHFSWWVGHGSVTTEQIAAEAEVVIGALEADRAAGRTDAVLRLSRAAAPALALTLRWGAWRQVLELGASVARQTGQRRDEAWFQHELGVYWLCAADLERAHAALQSARALRNAPGEARALAATHRLLALLQEEARPPAALEAETQLVRRPVIRVLAERSLRSARVPVSVLRGWSRRSVVVASGGLLALGVLGTAVGLSVAGTGGGPSGVQPGGTSDGTGLTGGAGLSGGGSGGITSPTAGLSSSPTASSTSPSASPSASPSPSAARTTARRTTAPSGSASPTGAPTSDPAAPTTSAPAPTHSTTSPPPSSTKPSTPPPTTTPPTTPPPTTPPPTSASSTS